MILADKIIRLRKKNGWSQEELAERLHVSRQAVSKWEAANTTPDLERVLQMSELFGVTTDYLLKDELEDEEYTPGDDEPGVRRVSLEEAQQYIAWRIKAAKRIALATFLCVVAVVPMLIAAALTGTPETAYEETLVGGVGMGLLLLMVGTAVVMYIHCGFKNEPYALPKEFETAYGVSGLVREKQKELHGFYVKSNLIGVILCIVGTVLLVVSGFFGNDVLPVYMLAAMLVLVGVAVYLFTYAGVRWASLQLLLREGKK